LANIVYNVKRIYIHSVFRKLVNILLNDKRFTTFIQCFGSSPLFCDVPINLLQFIARPSTKRFSFIELVTSLERASPSHFRQENSCEEKGMNKSEQLIQDRTEKCYPLGRATVNYEILFMAHNLTRQNCFSRNCN
jgi:hypothetical protein